MNGEHPLLGHSEGREITSAVWLTDDGRRPFSTLQQVAVAA